MMQFNGKNVRALVAGLGLLAAAGVASAYDTETDTIEIMAASTELSVDPGGFAVKMSTPETLGTGRCGTEGFIEVGFNGEASKALYQALVAANANGRTVTLHYVFEDDVCTLGYAVVH